MAIEFDPTSAKPTEPSKFAFDPDTATPDAGPKRSLADYARDVAATAVKGAIGVPEAIVGLADIPTGGRVGKFLENEGGSVGFRPKQAKELVNDWHSDATKEAQRKFQEADGIVDKTVTALQNPSLIATAVGESLPSMGLGGVAARGLMAATKLGQMGAKGAALAGAAGEGVTMAGSAAEQIRQETPDGLLTPGQSALAGATGIVGGAVGTLGGRVAQKLGIGDVDTMIAQGAKGMADEAGSAGARAATNLLVQQQAVKGIPRRVIEGAISEGFLEELPQSLAEQIFQNLALGKDWLQDVDSAAVMGVLSGAAMGGAAAGYHGARQPAPGADLAPPAGEPGQPVPPPTGDASAAPSAGMDRVRQAYTDQLAALQAQEQGEQPGPQTTPPDGAAMLAQQQAAAAARRQVELDASRAVTGPDDEIFQSTGVAERPSVRMGLDPAAGPLSAGAALAVDTGVTGQMQQAAAQAQAAELAAKEGQKPAAPTQKQEQQPQAQQGVDPETGEIPPGGHMAGWSDAQLSDAFRGAQTRDVRMQLAQELSRRRAEREQLDQQALQAELDAEQAGTVPGAERADGAFASMTEDAGPVPADLSVPLTTQGVTDGPQAAQAQQDRAQPPQVGATPADASAAPDAQGSAGSQGAVATTGVADGSPSTANPGAQAAAAPGAQAAPAAETREQRAQRVASAGDAWTRMPAAERQAVAQRTDLKPIARKNVHGAAWGSLNGDIQRKLADAISPPQQPAALMQQAQAATKSRADARESAAAQSAPAAVATEPAGPAEAPAAEPAPQSPAQAPAAVEELVQESPAAVADKAPAATKSAADAPAKEQGAVPAAAAPKKPRGVLAKKAEAEAKARADYFAPGNVVQGYSGHDRVIAYQPAGEDGQWSVTVRAVEKQGDAWVDKAGERERVHGTQPDAKALKAGPVARGSAIDEPAEATGSKETVEQPAAVAQPKKDAEQRSAAKQNITDFGEKIGGARKDTAAPTGPKAGRTRNTDERPAWARRFEVSQIVKSSRAGEEGRWSVHDTRSKDALNQPRRVGERSYASEDEALQAIPLIAVAQKHRAVPVREGDGTGWEIWRDVTERKRVKVVDLVFATREAALEHMAKNAQQIIETNTTFGEADLPQPDSDQRIGAARRDGDARDSDFTKVFGFRGVEFGNWNNQKERQDLLNDAYDGLLDLAEVMGIPPRAISLNGELALAFGARGKGLSGARAHYELDKAVINLTKLNGAGSLAHEWFHALDHYFGRQDGKAPAEWVVAKDGTRSFAVHLAAEDSMASGGTRGERSGMRAEVREAYADLMRTISRKAEGYVADTGQADRFVASARKDVERRLKSMRDDLARNLDERYYKRHNKPASAEQLAEFDTLAERIVAGELLELHVESKAGARAVGSGIRWTNDALNKLSAVMKAVRGRQGFNASGDGPLDRLRGDMQFYSSRLKMLADAQSGAEKTRMVPTRFVMDAKELDQGRGQDYWTKPHELAARAFQGYVEDKIAAQSGKSPFLNHGPENAGIATPWGWKRPFPAGVERKAINAAFDNLADVIQTREGEGGNLVLFSRSTESVPQSAAEWLSDTVIADEVEKRIGDFAQQPPIRIRDTAFGQLPGVARNDNVAGAVHDGAIYLFRDQLGDRAAVQRTLFHELFHFGLRKFLTKEQFTGQMMDLYRRDKAIRDEADRWAATADGLRAEEFGGREYALARGVDEALAILAEPNGGPHLNQTARAMLVRRVTNWLADVAQFLKMDKAAAYLRSLHNSEARAYIQSVFKRLESDAGRGGADWSESGGPAFSRASTADMPADGSAAGAGFNVDGFLSTMARSAAVTRAAGTTDRAVMDMVREGKPASDILRLVAGTSKSRFNRQVARLLLKSGITPTVQLEHGDLGSDGGFKFLGKYSRKFDTVTMTPGAELQAEHIVMHELMHAATLRALDRKGLASLQMHRLYEHVKRQGGAAGEYGMKNVGEFVAEAFTNPEFQRALRGISAPPGGTLKTAWDGFVRILRSILGLPQDAHDALSQALELGVAVMREDMALRQRGKEQRQVGDAFVQSPQTRATYEGRIDTLFNGGKAQVGTAVLDRSDVMGLLGHSDVPLMLNERHLLDGLTNHPEMTAAAWKKVPGWLENPAMVYSDPRDTGRLVVIAPELLAGYPVMLVVEPAPTPAERGKAAPFQLLVTAYAKTGSKIPAPGFLAASGNLQYLDTKNAPEVLRRAGVQFPGQAALQRGRKKILTEKHLNGWRKAHISKPPGTTDFDATTSGALPSNARSDAGKDRIVAKQGADGQSERDEAFFGAADLGALKTSALDKLHQTMSHPGKVSLWDKTVGTMRHLGERSPAFKPVYEAAQQFIDDVSMLGNDAADRAPRLLPRVETLADLKKKPITAADNKAIGRPIFEGTLMWGRDVDGTAVLVEDLTKKYANLPADDKAQLMLRGERLDPGVLKMWKGLPLAQYEAAVNSRFDSKVLKPGVVWSAKELETLFSLSPEQVSLYQEARGAIDRSIDMTARADMLRALGAGYAALREPVLSQASAEDAMALLTDTLQAEARENPDQAGRLLGLNNAVVKTYERAKELQQAGYAPLSRFGRYTVDVVGQDGTREYFGMFETMRDANLMAERMRREFKDAAVTQGTMSDEAYKLFQGITPESLEQFGGMLGLDSQGEGAQDKAFQAYLQLAKNNNSALKRLIHRKGITGYSEDVGRVLAGFVYSNARLAAGGLNAGTLEQAIQDIPKEQGELRDVAMGLRSYIQDPQEEGQAVRGMLFAQYLGGSAASALVNMTQPFQITMPWLSQYGGMRKAAAQMAGALRDMARGGKYEPDLAQALQSAQDDGVVSPQEIHQLMAQARGTGSLRTGDGTRMGDARAAAANNWERVKVAWGQPFALAEQFNRRSTFIAAYRMAKEQGLAAPAQFARRAVVETQFVYSKANKPKWARGAVGGTLFTFKTYSVSYLELMQRMWTQGGPEGKRAVGWAVAMLLLAGGAGGLPFMQDAEDLIDGAGQLMGYNISTKHWRKQLLRDTIGRELGDFVEQGVSGLPGAPIDVSGRLGMGNLLPGTGLLMTKQSRERDLLEIAGPAGDLVARGFTGARKALTGDVAGAALEVAPTAVRNAVKGADMATSGIYKDTKGYKVIDTTLDEAIAKAIGFQPRSVADDAEATAYKQRMKSFYVQSSAEIKAQWADALFRKDEAALQRVRERLADWNEDNPDQPIVVKMPDIWKKVREMGKDRTQRIADTAPKALRGQMREMARENG